MRCYDLTSMLDNDLDNDKLTLEQELEVIEDYREALDSAEDYADAREAEIRERIKVKEAKKPKWLKQPYEEEGTPLLSLLG